MDETYHDMQVSGQIDMRELLLGPISCFESNF